MRWLAAHDGPGVDARGMAPRHLLVLGDQLTRQVGPLAGATLDDVRVVMIESRALARAIPHHKQKLAVVFAAMRHFAASLRADGVDVSYLRAASFADGIASYLAAWPGARLEVMEPNDAGVAADLRRAAEAAGGRLTLLPNELWLTDADDFDAWMATRSRWRMEDAYRRFRVRHDVLMDGDRPEGGRWNYDADNRAVPPADHRFVPPPRFVPDAVTRGAAADVEALVPDHPGRLRSLAWPVTRAQALDALEHFVRHRLPGFGPYQDAMRRGERVLDHSLLSVPLNLGLLHPREVLDAAVARYRDGSGEVPLASVEGFVRQVLGWREYLRHVYRHRGDALRHANVLEHHGELAPLYWSGDTAMACVADALDGVLEVGYAHHIERLMLFGNLALLLGTEPGAVLEWFTAMFVDALDWVMVPNVLGMSQWADGGGVTSKPYVAAANYIDAMSDHCGACAYRRDRRHGADACPFNALYWDFIDRHAERLHRNPRMRMAVASLRRMGDEERARIRVSADDARRRAADGRL